MEPPTSTLQENKGMPIKKKGNSDFLHKQFLSSLDLNQPAQIDTQDQRTFEVEPTMMEMQKGGFTELEKNENINPSQKSSSSGLDSDNLDPTCVMGCTFCLMFVITSKAYPKCPACKKNMMMVISK
ncbi:hypothetical protein TSUD_47600 [Trifolium subterraneum]|nr:hypothetical protein TSUD_47600 [Trifolium subterraneum]